MQCLMKHLLQRNNKESSAAGEKFEVDGESHRPPASNENPEGVLLYWGS